LWCIPPICIVCTLKVTLGGITQLTFVFAHSQLAMWSSFSHKLWCTITSTSCEASYAYIIFSCLCGPHSHISFDAQSLNILWSNICILTRARIRAPFEARLSPLKRQDIPTPLTMWRPRLTMSRQRFRTRGREDPGQDLHWQDVQSLASWLHLRPVSH
jgi:hypothetical protein